MNLRDCQADYNKLTFDNVKALSDSDLISALLGRPVGDDVLAALAMTSQTALERLRTASSYELEQIRGIGAISAQRLLCAIELGKRVSYQAPQHKEVIDDSSKIANALSPFLMGQEKEHFAIAVLDIRHRLLGIKVITVGTATETLAHPREIFREVIRHGGQRCIVAHNHPSGNLKPSPEDLALTRKLLQAAQTLAMPLLDHLILGVNDYQSLRETTNLWDETPQDA